MGSDLSVNVDRMQVILDRRSSSHSGDEALRVPFQLDGWLVAACGHALLAFRSDAGAPYSGTNPKLVPIVREVLEVELGGAMLPIARLRELAVIPNDLPPCGHCRSTGKISCNKCSGNGYADCECECGDVHDKKCSCCNGAGGFTCGCGWASAKFLATLVLVDGQLFDAALIGEYLAAVRAEEFRFTRPKDGKAWIIGGADWRLAIMGARGDAREREAAGNLSLDECKQFPEVTREA